VNAEAVLGVFRETLAEVEERDFGHVTAETLLADLEVDSVAMMEVIGCIEDDLDLVIPDDAFTGAERVADVVAAICARLPKDSAS
jgi:acyl carrier protein